MWFWFLLFFFLRRLSLVASMSFCGACGNFPHLAKCQRSNKQLLSFFLIAFLFASDEKVWRRQKEHSWEKSIERVICMARFVCASDSRDNNTLNFAVFSWDSSHQQFWSKKSRQNQHSSFTWFITCAILGLNLMLIKCLSNECVAQRSAHLGTAASQQIPSSSCHIVYLHTFPLSMLPSIEHFLSIK